MVMEKPAGPRRRKGTLAKTACVACRGLRMKCVGADNPPCARCCKSGRFCVIPPSSQHNHPGSIPIDTVQSSSAPKWTSAVQVSNAESINGAVQAPAAPNGRRSIVRSTTTPTLTATPSTIFTTTPSLQSPTSGTSWQTSSSSPACATPIRPAFDYAAIDFGQASCKGEAGGRLVSSRYNDVNISEAGWPLPSDGELLHLGRFFVANLLTQVPVLTELDVGDMATTIQSKRPLAYSMAYVAAHFVPGCKAIRTTLAPIVTSMAKLQLYQLGIDDRTEEGRWTLLQSLAVLYSWASPSCPSLVVDSRDSSQTELRQDMLRASMETLALRCSLHKSAQGVADLIKQGVVDKLSQAFAVRKYLYWLWLFSLAHFRSLITQTPPTIREDATIIQAARLLEDAMKDRSVRWILARVELCLLWMRAGFHERHLGEWWCTISTQIDLETALAVLGDLDAALYAWRQKWCPPERQSHRYDSDELSIDFEHHFTRFCIGTYVAQIFHSSSLVESLPRSMTQLVMKAVERAATFCHVFLDLSPLAKSSIGFSPETTFAMLALSCDYMIQVHRTSAELDLVQTGRSSTILGVAQLMIDLGVDDKHSAKVHGQNVLAKLTAATKLASQPTITLPSPQWQQPQPQPQQQQQQQQKPSTYRPSASQTPIVASSESIGAQTLLSFATATDNSWSSLQASMGPCEMYGGDQHGLGISMGAHDGGGVWPGNYHGTETLVGGGPFWTS